MQKVCKEVRVVMINQGLSWIVFAIWKSCWQTALQVLSNFDRILPNIVC